jgi:hypothetical protein
MKPPVKSLLSFKSRSQAPGWITFEAENGIFLNFSVYYNKLWVKCQVEKTGCPRNQVHLAA